MRHNARSLAIAPSASMLAALLLTCPASAVVRYSTRCHDVAVLKASGYPGLKRKYSLRGNCAVRYWKADDAGISEGTVLNFFAQGEAKWDGESQKTTEGLVINGQKVSIEALCNNDPFVALTSCKDAKITGNVDMKIQTAVLDSHHPIFRESVSPSIAEALSKQVTKSSQVPPPPAPKQVTVPAAKIEPAGPVKLVTPSVPVPRVKAADQPPGAGTSKAKPSAGMPFAISPTKTPARPGGRRLRSLPTPTPTPTAAGRRK